MDRDAPACPPKTRSMRASAPWPTLLVIAGVLIVLLAAGTLLVATQPWLDLTRWVLAGGMVLAMLGALELLRRRLRAGNGLASGESPYRRIAQVALVALLSGAFLIALWPASDGQRWFVNALTLVLVASALWLGYRLWRSGPPSEYRRALKTYQQGHWQATISLLDMVHEQQPDFYPAYALRVRACRAEGQYDRARQACERMVTLAPNLYHGYAELGLTLLEEGRPQEAVAPLQRAVEISPRLSEAHFNLGMAHVEAGQLRQAAEVLTQALRLGLRDEVTQLMARFYLWQSWQTLECEQPAREALSRLQRMAPILKRWQREINMGGLSAADRKRDQELVSRIDEALARAARRKR
ncbi:MAG: tetratricopeptide repeat protein [Anaerolineae bacterium]